MASRPKTSDLLALLWGEPSSADRGPKASLSVAEVVATAIGIADAQGLDAVSFRRLAEPLGVTPMALYTYVPHKAALLQLMVDHVYRSMELSWSTKATWRERVVALADANRALYARHPWLLDIEASKSRPVLGPGRMAKYESELRALEGVGLDDATMDAALTFVLGFVESSAREEREAERVARESKMTDEEWWAKNAPPFVRVFDPDRFPLAARVGSNAAEELGGAYQPDAAYRFGLARVLDGLAALIVDRTR